MPRGLWTVEDIGTQALYLVTGYSPDQREPGDGGIGAEESNHSSKPVARGLEHQKEGPQKESSELQAGEEPWRNTEQWDPSGQKRADHS